MKKMIVCKQMLRRIIVCLFLPFFSSCVGMIDEISRDNHDRDNPNYAPSSDFLFVKADLQSLKGANDGSVSLDSLLDDANVLSQMYDKCASISITDVLDTTCEHFYSVRLPEFEKRYSEISGEIRIGKIQLENVLQDRIARINACAEALKVFFLPVEYLFETKAEIADVIPLNADGSKFKVNYDISVRVRREAEKWMENTVERWQQECDSAVTDKYEKHFIPMFVERIKAINEEMRKNGSVVNLSYDWDFTCRTCDTKKEELKFELRHRSKKWTTRTLLLGWYLNGKSIVRWMVGESSENGYLQDFLLMEYRGDSYGNKIRAEVNRAGIKGHRKGVAEFTGEFPRMGLKGRWAWDY